MQSAARGCSGTARNAPFQRITLSARAREMRQKLPGCDCFPCFPIESSRNYFRCPFAFVHSSDCWDRSIGERSIDRSRTATALFARSRRNVKTLRTIYDTWLLPLFYGAAAPAASFLRRDNRRMNGKWVKSVSGKIKSEKLPTIARHGATMGMTGSARIFVESFAFHLPLHLRYVCWPEFCKNKTCASFPGARDGFRVI